MGNICANDFKKPFIRINSNCCKNEQSYSVNKCAYCSSVVRIPRESENQKKEKQILKEY
jgi:hypothetical protein